MIDERDRSGWRLPTPAACLAGVGVVATLAMAAALIRFACPVADDFHRAGAFWSQGFFNQLSADYYTWSGRWAGIGLGLLVLSRIDLVRWYPALLGVLALTQGLGLAAFWRTLLGGSAPRRQVLILAVASLALLWAGLPIPAETTHWATGAFENQLNISLGLMLIAGLVSAPRSRSRPGFVGRTAALSLLAFVLPGMHELIGMMLCLVLGVGAGLALLARRPAREVGAWGAVVLAASAGMAVVVLAPGNAIRASTLPERGGLAAGLLVAAKHAWTWVPGWVLDVRLLAATLAMALSPSMARARPDWPRWGKVPPLAVVVPVWFLVVAGMFLVPGVILQQPLPGRTLDAAYTLFLLGWIVAAFVGTRARGVESPVGVSPTAATRTVRSAALAVLGLALILSGNTRAGIEELHAGSPQRWSSVLRWRDRMLTDVARGGATRADVPPLDRLPLYRMYMGVDVREDPKYWVNKHVASYYRLEGVRALPPGTRLAVRPEAVGLKPPDRAAR